MKYIDKKVFTHKPPGDSRQQMYYSCETESRYITALQVELVVPECRYLIKLCALLLFVLAIATFNFSTCVVLFCSGQIVTSLNMPFHSFQGHPLLINILQQWAHSVKWHLLQLLATWFCTRYNLCTSSHILFFVCHDINHTLQEAAIGGKVWQLDCIYPSYDERTLPD